MKSAKLLAASPIRVAPGQSRPLAIMLVDGPICASEVELKLTFLASSQFGKRQHQLPIYFSLHQRRISEPHKITFLHPSGSVSYAILQAPAQLITVTDREELPILLNLHGAGLEADSHQVRHQLDSLSNLNAWVIFPTGMSPWSGDDWHSWALSDVKAAIAEIPHWIERMGWNGLGASLNRWLVSGHSNGGQGTWYISSHQPDNVIAAAPVSGYTSIENYVPYVMWSEADPLKSAVLYIARSTFRHELLVENLGGIPIFQQHGSADDNVPPYHSRLMNSLLSAAKLPSTFDELAGKGHWFDGVMTTEPLKQFYLKHLQTETPLIKPPERFSLIYPNSNDMGSRYGIIVEQLESPDRFGQIDVSARWEKDKMTWWVKTSNIHRLHLKDIEQVVRASTKVYLDDTLEPFDPASGDGNTTFIRAKDGKWVAEHDPHWRKSTQRYGHQRGTLDAIMQTTGPLQLIPFSDSLLSLATQTSRNMLQYYGADSEILCGSEYSQAIYQGGNVITFALGGEVPGAVLENFPVYVEPDCICLRRRNQPRITAIPFAPGLGALFLRPLIGERLELVVWGFDEVGIRQAARLIPTLTGVGQPDFTILDNKARWQGHAGSIALGFFDYEWNISSASYVP
jgi:predicted esterase